MKGFPTFFKRPAQTASDPLAELTALLDSLADCIIQFDRQGRIIYTNAAWQRLTGIAPADACGEFFEDFLHPQERGQWHALFDAMSWRPELLQAIDARQYDDAETDQPHPATDPIWVRLLNHQQATIWCELRLQPMNTNTANNPGSTGTADASPAPGRYCATLCDITSQVQANQQASANQRGLTSMLGRLPLMIYRSRNDRDWTMEYVSDGCYDITGYHANELLERSQKTLGKLIHPADADYVWENVQAALQQRGNFELNYRLYHTDGRLQYVTEKGHGVYSRNGNVLAIEGVIFSHEGLMVDVNKVG